MAIKKTVVGGVIITTGKLKKGEKAPISPEQARSIAQSQSRNIQAGSGGGPAVVATGGTAGTPTQITVGGKSFPSVEAAQLQLGGREVLRETSQRQSLLGTNQLTRPGIRDDTTFFRLPSGKVTFRPSNVAPPIGGVQITERQFKNVQRFGRESISPEQVSFTQKTEVFKPKGVDVGPGIRSVRTGFEPLYLNVESLEAGPIGREAELFRQRRIGAATELTDPVGLDVGPARRASRTGTKPLFLPVESPEAQEIGKQEVARMKATEAVVKGLGESRERVFQERATRLGEKFRFVPRDIGQVGKVVAAGTPFTGLVAAEFAPRALDAIPSDSLQKTRQEFEEFKSPQVKEFLRESAPLSIAAKKLQARSESRKSIVTRAPEAFAAGVLEFGQEVREMPITTIGLTQAVGPAFGAVGKALPKAVTRRISERTLGLGAAGVFFGGRTTQRAIGGDPLDIAAFKTAGEFVAFGALAEGPKFVARAGPKAFRAVEQRIRFAREGRPFEISRLKKFQQAETLFVGRETAIETIVPEELRLLETEVKKFKKPPKVQDVFYGKIRKGRKVKEGFSELSPVETRGIEEFVKIEKLPKGKGLKLTPLGYPEVTVGPTTIVTRPFEVAPFRVTQKPTKIPFQEFQTVRPSIRTEIRDSSLFLQEKFTSVRKPSPFSFEEVRFDFDISKTTFLTKSFDLSPSIKIYQRPQFGLGDVTGLGKGVKFAKGFGRTIKFKDVTFREFPSVSKQKVDVKGFGRKVGKTLEIRESVPFESPEEISSIIQTELSMGETIPKSKLPKDIKAELAKAKRAEAKRLKELKQEKLLAAEPITATVLTAEQLFKPEVRGSRRGRPSEIFDAVPLEKDIKISDILGGGKVSTIPVSNLITPSKFKPPKLDIFEIEKIKTRDRFKPPSPIFDVEFRPPKIDQKIDTTVGFVFDSDVTQKQKSDIAVVQDFKLPEPKLINDPIFDPDPEPKVPGGLPFFGLGISDIPVTRRKFRVKAKRRRILTPTLIEAAFGDFTPPKAADIGPIFTGFEPRRLSKKRKPKKKKVKKKSKKKKTKRRK